MVNTPGRRVEEDKEEEEEKNRKALGGLGVLNWLRACLPAPD